MWWWIIDAFADGDFKAIVAVGAFIALLCWLALR
jgi:hypothetical protein